MQCEEFMDWVDTAEPNDLQNPNKERSLHIKKCKECRSYWNVSKMTSAENDDTLKVDLWPKFCDKIEKRQAKRKLGFRFGAGLAAVAAAFLIAVLPITLNQRDETKQKATALGYLSRVNTPDTDNLTMVDGIYNISTNEYQDTEEEPDSLDYYYALAK